MDAQSKRVQGVFDVPQEVGSRTSKPSQAKSQSPQLCGNVNERAVNWLQLGSHWIRLEELKTHAALKGVIQKGTGKMNSAHVLNVFSKFEDDDWDRALVIWWLALAVFCVFGGAISAAVWA